MLNLIELMNLDIMEDAKVLAGKECFDNEIKSVSVLEIPEKTPFIKEGELLISAFYSIKEDIDKQIEVIKMLNEVKASGLILSHVNIALNLVPQKLIDICNKLKFPLIVAPSNLPYIDIITPIMDTLLLNHNKNLQKTLKVYDMLLETMIDQQDFKSILKILYKIIDTKIIYFDCNLNCIFQIGLSEKEMNIKEILRSNINNNMVDIMNKKDLYVNDLNYANKWLLSPVISNLKFYGVLAIADYKNLHNVDYVAINQTKNMISMIVLNRMNQEDYRNSIKKDFIIDLISNKPIDSDLLLKRGLGLGYQVNLIKLAMVLDIYKFNSLTKTNSERDLLHIKKEVFQTVKDSINIRNDEYISITHSDKIIILFYQDLNKKNTIKKAYNMGNYLMKEIRDKNNIEVSVGIGKYYNNFLYIYKSYYEAQSAVKISNNLFLKPSCTLYTEIEIYDVLFKDIDSSIVETSLKKIFSPLIEHDLINNSELLHTFITLFKNNINTKMTSRKLFIHENTVRQRQNKIIECLGINPFIYPDFRKYNLAILLKDYFEITFI